MSRVVIFANGQLNQLAMLKARLQTTDRIFCADGGLLHALALDRMPDAIVGDLDSIPPEMVKKMAAKKVIIHHYPPAKDQTDLELTLEWALKERPAEIMLVTALGGRLDQMLANILLLTRPAYRHITMTLADGPQWGRIIRPHQPCTVTGQPGDTLSLVPLTPTVSGVTLTGVGWPLTDATLELGSTWSISNQMTGPEATVSIDDGMALMVHIAVSRSAVSRSAVS